MVLTLGDPIEDAARPSFHALLDGRPALVELDSGAVFMLAKHATGDEMHRLLAAKRSQILSAAARLAEEGFVVEGNGLAEILVTALDL